MALRLIRLTQTPKRSLFWTERLFMLSRVGRLVIPVNLLLMVLILNVTDTVKSGDAFLHRGQLVNGSLAVGDKVRSVVDRQLRDATRLNHSATHLMHAALRTILGEHVNQRGSLVNADRLRFDFSHFEAVSREQLREIERLVNAEISREQ